MAVEFITGTDEVKLWVRGFDPSVTTLPSWNGDPSADPVTSVGGISTTISGDLLYPIVRLAYGGTYRQPRLTTFFREEEMVGPIPLGFSAWSEEVVGTTPTNARTRRLVQAMYRGTAPTTARRAIIDNLITDIGEDLFANYMDRFYVIGAHDYNASLLDFVTGRNVLVQIPDNDLTYGPIFTPDLGRTGRGGDYDNVYFTYAAEGTSRMLRDSAHMGLWSWTDVANSSGGTAHEFGSLQNTISRASTGGITVKTNTSLSNTLAGVSIKGYTAWTRSTSTGATVYKNVPSTSTVSVAGTITRTSATLNTNPETRQAQLHATSDGRSGANQLFAAHRGLNLSAAQVAQVYSALRDYAIDIGLDPDA